MQRRFLQLIAVALLAVLPVRTQAGEPAVRRPSKSWTANEAMVRQGERLSKEGKTALSLMTLNRYIELSAGKTTARNDTLLLTRAMMCNARNYENLGNQHQALKLMQRALVLAKATGDKRQLAALYNNIFAIYYARKEFSQAEDLLQMSLQMSLAARDSISIRNNYNNFGLVCYERGQCAKALAFMDKALRYAPASDPVGTSQIFTNRAEVFLKQGKTGLAERSLQRALFLHRGHSGDNRTVQPVLNMALLKARLGKRGEAMAMRQSLYRVLPRLPMAMQAEAYEQMADINFALRDSMAALHDIMRYLPLRDSLQRADNNGQLQQLLVAYDADRLKQHNTNLRQTVSIYRLKAEGRTRLLTATVVFLLILAALLVVLWRRMKADRAKSLLISMQQRQLLAYEQQEREREQQEMRRKQEEMRHKQEELKRRQQEMALELDHKNRQLTSYTLDLAEELKELILSLQHFNDKPLGDDFRVYFDEVHPGFLLRLSESHASLSKSDLRLCAYLHLGMTTKEIAALTFKEVRSVESARNRLRKKLGLPPETNLGQYLARFAQEGV